MRRIVWLTAVVPVLALGQGVAKPSSAAVTANVTSSTNTEATPGSDASKANSIQGVTGGKAVHVISDPTSVVAIAGAAKGATTTAQPTVTAAGADRNALDVILRSSSGAELAQNANGQATMANSAPVTIASNQSSVAVTPSVMPQGTTWSTVGTLADGATASQRIYVGGAGSRYVTDIVLSNGGTAQSIYISTGTGSTCGTGTAVLVPKVYLAANSGAHLRFAVPLTVAASTDICAIISGSTAYSAMAGGIVGP